MTTTHSYFPKRLIRIRSVAARNRRGDRNRILASVVLSVSLSIPAPAIAESLVVRQSIITDGAAQLTQTVAGPQTFAQQRHSLGRSVLIGAAVGAGIGLTIGYLASASYDQSRAKTTAAATLSFAALGAAVGLAIGR